jgi:hypothetical protein
MHKTNELKIVMIEINIFYLTSRGVFSIEFNMRSTIASHVVSDGVLKRKAIEHNIRVRRPLIR